MDYLSKERLGIMLTTRCTLRCRGCYLMIPEQKPWDADFQEIKAALPKIFEVFDHFDQVCLMGGEPFLYPELAQVLMELSQYQDKFEFARICTNATLIPDEKLVRTLKSLDYHADIRISNYGACSSKTEELTQLCMDHGIHLTTVNYTDEEQYCGGWVEFGVNWEDRHYSETRLQELYDCCNYKTFFNWGRYVYRCPTVSGAVQLGKLTVPEQDKIDLFSEESVGRKREKVRELVSRPQDACRHCDSFDAENGVRFKAGEQL